MKFPHSIGLLYSTFTSYAGFRVNSGEYKLMGLAPYGKPRFANLIFDRLIDLRDDGSFELNLEYFNFSNSERMFNRRFEELFCRPARLPESHLDEHTADIAASIQTVLETVVLKMAAFARAVTGEENLCLAGGVALNCVANGKILRSQIFKKIWIQPAAGDAGGAIGAALAAHALHFRQPIAAADGTRDQMRGSYLGPSYSVSEIRSQLSDAGAVFRELSTAELIETAATALECGRAIGWHQGAMEFGPRALGNRSILADARNSKMQQNLNLKIKFRESFRPFAPVILAERANEWFDLSGESPYMSLVVPVLPAHHVTEKADVGARRQEGQFFDRVRQVRSSVPAITHVDLSARVQTADRATNPLLCELLERFDAMTGVPMLVNTSFNVRGEPIVESPRDAFRCFMGTDLDALAVGPFWLEKSEQRLELQRNYGQLLQPD